MNTLVKWWFIFWSCIIGAAVAQSFDLFTKLWYADATKMSFVTIALFMLVTVYIGFQTNSARKSENVSTVEKNLPGCWFASEAMNAFGMIGTVAGFIIMLSTAFHNNINPSDQAGIQQLITSTAIGLSTAATTTLVGLICSTITKLQLVVLERSITDETDTE